MPGNVVKQGVRKSPPIDDKEQEAEFLRREVFQLLSAFHGAVNSSVREVTADDSVLASDEVLLVDASGGDVTLSLPSAAFYFRRLLVKRIDASDNTVTVSALSGQTIEGQSEVTLDSKWAGLDITARGEDSWIQASYSAAAVSLRPRVFELSDTSLTLAGEHVFNYVVTTAGSAVTLTINDDDSVFQAGDWVRLFQAGAGALTLAAGSGVTLRYPETLAFYKQYSSGIITKRSSKLWDVDIDAVLA